MARQGLFLKNECTCKYTIDLKIILNTVIRNKPTLNMNKNGELNKNKQIQLHADKINKHQITLLNSGSALSAFKTSSEIDDLLEPAVNRLEFAKRKMQRKKKYDANTYEVKFVSIDDLKLPETSLARKVSFNLYKNFIKQEMTPAINNIVDLAKANVVVGSTLVAAEAGLAVQAMNASTKLLMGKAFLGGTQGVFGAWAAGGDKYDLLSGSLVGLSAGVFNISSIIPYKLSAINASMVLSGFSNLAGQGITKLISPDLFVFSKTSFLFSIWGGGISSYITKDMGFGVSRAVIESTIQTPIDAVGGHL